jgi:hypothetical protein
MLHNFMCSMHTVMVMFCWIFAFGITCAEDLWEKLPIMYLIFNFVIFNPSGLFLWHSWGPDQLQFFLCLFKILWINLEMVMVDQTFIRTKQLHCFR